MKFLLIFSLTIICGSLFSQNFDVDTVIRRRIEKNYYSFVCFDKKSKAKRFFDDGITVHEIRQRYDKNKHMIDERYLDTASNFIENYDVSRVFLKYKKDKKSNDRYWIIRDTIYGNFKYFDNKGREWREGEIKMNDTAKVNFWEIKYYEHPSIIKSEIFYKKEGALGLANGFEWSAFYKNIDNRKNIIREYYTDSVGKLVDNEKGIALIRTNYIERKIQSIEWYNQDSAFTESDAFDAHYSKVNFIYNHNNLIEINCFKYDGSEGCGRLSQYIPNHRVHDNLHTMRIKMYYNKKRVIKIEYYVWFDVLKKIEYYGWFKRLKNTVLF